MSEEVDWETFIRGFKPRTCRVVDGKLVCEGTMDDEVAVCEITKENGKQKVSCVKMPVKEVV